jgi:hypothetical protein
MDTTNGSLKDLVTAMELQVQGLEIFQATQLEARDALKAKDWPALERVLRALDFQAEGLRYLEERRSRLWMDIQLAVLGREGRFYETVPLLPQEFREPLTRLHQKLKLEAASLHGLSQAITVYVQTASALIQAVVQEIQPALKGRIYSRSGSLRGSGAHPLVLNTHF